jgi:hypothetical protein
MSGLITFFAAFFAILDRNSITPAAAGLSISYSLSVSCFS